MVAPDVSKPRSESHCEELSKEGFLAQSGGAERCSFTASFAVLTVKAIGRLPLSIRRWCGTVIGSIVGVFPSRERTIAALQLRYFLPEQPTNSTVRRTFANAGKTLMESLNLAPLIKPPYTAIRCDNWRELATVFNAARPTIALTAHTGNWDLLAAYSISRGIKISTIGREARSPVLQEVLRSIRDGYGINTIWRSDKAGIKKLLTLLKQGKPIAALIDQDTRVESLSIPFFSEPAKTPSSLIALGKKYDAQFLTIFLFRTSPSTYEVFAETLDPSLSNEEILTTYNQRLEALIRRFPEQWVWFHKRWRTSSDGVTKSSREYVGWLRGMVASREQAGSYLPPKTLK